MTGYIDIRFLAAMLGPPPGLGFDLTVGALRKAIDVYDKDEDHLLTLSEFRKLTKDPELIKRFVGIDEETWDTNLLEGAESQVMEEGGAVRRSASNSLNEPLIKVYERV